MMKRASRSLVALAIALAPNSARAQDAPPPPPPQPEARSTGLPSKLQWTFNFDAGWGNFGFANSLYNNPKDPGVDDNLSDQWFEGFVKPALSASYTMASSSEIYGKVSAVGERTYGSVPSEFGSDVSSFGPEDLYIGWRSGKSFDIGENALDFRVGRSQYRIGHGYLVYDGGAEGGSRGGYWTNARKAWEFAAIGRVAIGPHVGEVFYLDKDELPESDSGSRLWGANYELGAGENSTFGATYLKVFADEAVNPERDGLNVFNLRAYTAPIPSLPDFSLEFEYALENNGNALDSNAWTFQGAYQLSEVAWKPQLSYRYAFFEGDDPDTPTDENFDPLFLGFYDWGQWWQGEIAGEYFLSNSNLISNLFRVHVTPNDAIGTGLLFYQFKLDQPASYAPGVTDSDLAFEIDWYMDWKINKNFTASLLGAYADPGKAVQQAFDRTKNFVYGMVFVSYSF
jgi:Alginate export